MSNVINKQMSCASSCTLYVFVHMLRCNGRAIPDLKLRVGRTMLDLTLHVLICCFIAMVGPYLTLNLCVGRTCMT